MKRARKLLKWLKRLAAIKNVKWILVGLAALGILVKGWTTYRTNVTTVKEENQTLRKAIEEKDEKYEKLKRSKTQTVTKKVIIEKFDPETGKLLERVTAQRDEVLRLYAELVNESRETPEIVLPSQRPRPEPKQYPLGVFVTANHKLDVGGGLTWHLVPRVRLPFFPDPSIHVGIGARRTSDGVVGVGLLHITFVK